MQLPTNSNQKFFQLLFILLMLFLSGLELWLFSFGKNQFGVWWSPSIVFASGLLQGILFLFFFLNKKLEISKTRSNKKDVGILFLLFILGFHQCTFLFNQHLVNNPIDFANPTGSDIIPQINVLVTRFLDGIFPYQLITNEWGLGHHLFPTYLPLTWMPFVISEWINFDYRWVAYGALMIGFFFYWKKLVLSQIKLWSSLVLTVIPFLFLYAFLIDDNAGVFRFSIESLIAGYYLILAISFFSKSNLLIAFALVLCLLSRYAIVLWVPLFFWVLFFKEKRSRLFHIGGYLILGFLIFYGIPFLLQDPSIFMKGYEYHSKAAPQAWNILPWQNEGEIPGMLSGGYGLAIYCHEWHQGSPNEKLLFFRKLHFAITCLTVVFLMAIFHQIKDKINYRIFLLGSLKIYLVVFYNFIQMPFNYLFLTVSFISIPILALLFNFKIIRD